MGRSARLAYLPSLLCLPALLAAGLAGATNYSLWINGRTGGGAIGNYNDFAYFGANSVPAGVNKKSVNWDGRSSIASQSGIIRNALDCFCTGGNWCYIAVHSAGDLQIGYNLAQLGPLGAASHQRPAEPLGRARYLRAQHRTHPDRLEHQVGEGVGGLRRRQRTGRHRRLDDQRAAGQ